MPKFKVGDRVKVTSKPYCTRAIVGAEYTISIIRAYIGRNRGQLYGVEADEELNLYDCEIELAAPPLFRKGDKVLVEFTVVEDQTKAFSVYCTSPGMGLHRRSIAMLNAGTITRAPEPPYVPKVGDKFSFLLSSGEPLEHVNTLVFADFKGLLYEDEFGYRYTADSDHKYFKR